MTNLPLKRKYLYYYQSHGLVAICQLCFLDFDVYIVDDVYVQTIYFDEKDWGRYALNELTTFYFNFIMELTSDN